MVSSQVREKIYQQLKSMDEDAKRSGMSKKDLRHKKAVYADAMPDESTRNFAWQLIRNG